MVRNLQLRVLIFLCSRVVGAWVQSTLLQPAMAA